MSDTLVGECGKLSGSSTEMSPMTVLSEVPRPEAADLEAHWMPFTANRAFKKAPRLLAGAKGMHYITVDGRNIIDAAAGMWCCNAGHNRDTIVEAIRAGRTVAVWPSLVAG